MSSRNSSMPAANGSNGQQTNGAGRTEQEVKVLASFKGFGALLEESTAALGNYFDHARGRQQNLEKNLDLVETSMAATKESAAQATEAVAGMQCRLDSELAEIRGTANDAKDVSYTASSDAAAAKDKAEIVSGRVDAFESAYAETASSAVAIGLLKGEDVKGKAPSEQAGTLLSALLKNGKDALEVIRETLELVQGVKQGMDDSENVDVPECGASNQPVAKEGEKRGPFPLRVARALKGLKERVSGTEASVGEVRASVDAMGRDMETVASMALQVEIVTAQSLAGKTASGRAATAVSAAVGQMAALKELLGSTLEVVGSIQSTSDVGMVPNPQNLKEKMPVGGQGQMTFPEYVLSMFETYGGNIAGFRRDLREFEGRVREMVAAEVGGYITGTITPKLDAFGQKLQEHDSNVAQSIEAEVARVVKDKVETRLNLGADTFQDLREAIGIPIGKEGELSLNPRVEALETRLQSPPKPDAEAQDGMRAVERRLEALEARLQAVEDVKTMLEQLIQMQLDAAKPEGS